MRRAICFCFALFTLLLVATSPALRAQESVPLIAGKDATAGWKFNNGAEFPGAKGEIANDAGHDGQPAIKLVGDFTKGGGYVEAGRPINGVDIRELSFWLRNPTSDQFTLRLNDASGQTHQIRLKIEQSEDWQKVTLPLEAFFAKRGEAGAVPNISQYESWGGAKDGSWHGPATALYMLLGNPRDGKVHTLWLSDMAIAPKPVAVKGAEIVKQIPLDETLDGKSDWQFTRGEEFPGAKGSLSAVENEPKTGQSSLKMAGDFTGGGAYVAMVKNLKELGADDVTAVRANAKTENAQTIGVQMVDGSGQTHQKKDIKITADGKWHELTLKPKDIAGGEHWGGANDGKWHGPLTQLVISLSAGSDSKGKQPVLQLADIRAEALMPVFAMPPAFKANFEGNSATEGWKLVGEVKVVTADGATALRLARSVNETEKPCSATSPSFTVAPGNWNVALNCKAQLHSPDNSYSGVVELECLSATGQVIEKVIVAEVFGNRPWQPLTKKVEIPATAKTARLHAQLNKTYGEFWIDDLSAAYLAPAPRKDDRIARILFASAQLGNLLFPNDPRTLNVTVEARKPLRDGQKTLNYVVRDYWGAEYCQPKQIALGQANKSGDKLEYQATINLKDVALEVGRYYEVHGWIAGEGDEPFRHYTSLAILPEAVTKQYKPADVPFTSRNWDNRLSEYIRLSDRLGVRVCGLWGGWSASPPYKPEAPGLDLCQQLGMGWLTNTPAAQIELGKREYSEEALRDGVRNLIKQYGKVRPMYINLGNEPHGTGDRVLANVAAYKVIYEEVKKVDPTIPVIATSVEPNEEYFKAGYGKYCDAFDFHIYEQAEDVRRTMGEYRALMKKYDCEKPLWSTELGLNSQGQTRHTVASEVTKKFTTFFAAGGANMSWFGLLYPDTEGKLYGTSGDSHNVFDCRFNRYCPRLDAVAYYNAVNSIAVKKFVAERKYDIGQGVRAFLFQDREGGNLMVLWSEKGAHDIGLPLPGVMQVEMIRVDGGRSAYKLDAKALTTTVSPDPLIVLFRGDDVKLPESLPKPVATLTHAHAATSRGAKLDVQAQLPAGAKVTLQGPPLWTITGPSSKGGEAGYTLTPPAGDSAIREAAVTLEVQGDAGATTAVLYDRFPIAQ